MPLDFFEKIESHLENKLPFVVYRKPNEQAVTAICQQDDELHYLSDYTETGFVFAPFDSSSTTVLLKLDQVLRFTDFEDEEIVKSESNREETCTKQKAFHLDLVKKGIAEINVGNFDKVVLSRRIQLNMKTPPLALFRSLLHEYKTAFCYLWYHPKVGLWLGATPEILLTMRNRKITTMSLAGTQNYNNEENPEWGNKELEEQQLVTEYIFNALEGKVSDLERTPTESVRAGSLLHLRTKISGNSKQENLGEVIRALHPTPAVCGMPKEKTKAFILTNENYDREFYTGFLGELNFKTERNRNNRPRNTENNVYRSISKNTTLFVNLRCMQMNEDKVSIYVGGGITKDSNPEKEWVETVAKSKTMLKVIKAVE
ncbi:isochorismate synthase [Zobellia amurskyensis]|uniref:Isochorismate synthase n=1 Tax=Zobellia amurskyensis TaxID=248905 RepID=A0A7X2ZQJ6_9FLAO|nr:chorismate-binding protein [Zobellia amurskyensis]MUH34547.1 isochorismate synthase [Zobellia amurskyensis]